MMSVEGELYLLYPCAAHTIFWALFAHICIGPGGHTWVTHFPRRATIGLLEGTMHLPNSEESM